MNFYFDNTYDMSLENGNIRFTNDDNEVVQRLTTRLQFILGEWFLDTNIGLPYPQIIFEARTSLSEVHRLLSEEIEDTVGVEKLNSLVTTLSADERSILAVISVNQNTTLEITLP